MSSSSAAFTSLYSLADTFHTITLIHIWCVLSRYCIGIWDKRRRGAAITI